MGRRVPVLVSYLLLSAAVASAGPPCQLHFTVVRYDGQLLAFGQLSDAQQKWWVKKGIKKYKDACLDAVTPEYVIVWGKAMESHPGVAFVYHPGSTSTNTVQMQSGDTGTVTTTIPGTSEAVPTVRTVSRTHLYVFAWRNGKIEGPVWMNDRTGEEWGERAWGQVHPASQQLLDDALKFLSAKQ